ncbi:hypothetical protein CBM2599_A180104 [Cupriavidus taiwanensis]|nr:hypothetical protein CBM2599_A180104 [Cupriavidus taiwanensis]SOY86877.1 hypothetical protein CBM2600_A160106 [Cupriavidus taiwanensis]
MPGRHYPRGLNGQMQTGPSQWEFARSDGKRTHYKAPAILSIASPWIAQKKTPASLRMPAFFKSTVSGRRPASD